MTDETTPPTTPPTVSPVEPGPETPRPGRSFQGAAHPADERPISDLARAVGPPVAITSLVVTLALLAWMAIAPTAIEGSITTAPFDVPATLLLRPVDDGCLRLIEGDGSTVEHCDDAWADDTAAGRYVDAYFDASGRLLVGEYPELSVVDIETGEVLDSIDVSGGREPEPGRPFEEDGPVARTYEDRVYVDDDPITYEDEPSDDQLVLDLAGPWGYRVTDAALSPDGDWVLARTNRSQVVVAPTDGSTGPYLWTEVPTDRWVDLRSHVLWDD